MSWACLRFSSVRPATRWGRSPKELIRAAASSTAALAADRQRRRGDRKDLRNRLECDVSVHSRRDVRRDWQPPRHDDHVGSQPERRVRCRARGRPWNHGDRGDRLRQRKFSRCRHDQSSRYAGDHRGTELGRGSASRGDHQPGRRAGPVFSGRRGNRGTAEPGAMSLSNYDALHCTGCRGLAGH